ncbi:MAG: exodeoxyribonuclease V subunit beta [Myxococcota bacterium]
MSAKTLDPLKIPLRGPHLIEASAGTGKTYTIATLFVRLVVEQGMAVSEILVVTFTEAAAAELRDRVRTRLQTVAHVLEGAAKPDDAMAPWFAARSAHRDTDRRRVRAALQSFDEAAISTIHGFCHRVLQDSAFETGTAFETELVLNQQPILDQAIRDYWARTLYSEDSRFVTHALRTNLLPPQLLSLGWIVSANPGVPLLPPPPETTDGDVATAEAAFGDAFDRARALWHEHQDEIRSTVLQHGGLSKVSYKPHKIAFWLAAAAAFFGETAPGERLGFEGLDKLTADALEAGTNKGWLKKGGEPPRHAFFEACADLERGAAPLRADLQRRWLGFKHGLARFIEKELPARKQASGVQSFDDLLQRLAGAVTRRRTGKLLCAAIRETYRAALIDEFQDTDPIQFTIFHTVFAGGSSASSHPLLMIGDPKQAIYGFRGADVFAYLDAAQGVSASRRHTMTTNWRSDPGVLSAVEHLFTTPAPFVLDGIDFVPVAPRPGATDALTLEGRPLAPFELMVQRREPGIPSGRQTDTIAAKWVADELPRRIAADIRTLLASGAQLDGRPVRARDVAVLSRTNAQAQRVQAALRELDIPGVVYGDSSVYDSTEYEELERVLCAVAEPTSTRLLRAALTTEMLGVSGGDLEKMDDDDEAWDHWAQRFRRWHAAWVQRGFIHMLRKMLGDLRLGETLLRLRDGERRMTNLLHLTELLHEASSREHLGPAGLLHWMTEQKASDQKLAAEAVKLRLERDDEAVQLITIHRSKGLEYPIVYCPYLWGGTEPFPSEFPHLKFHDPDDDNALKVDISRKPEHPKEKDRLPSVRQAKYESFAEGLRLLYVALTRARHRCVLVWGRFEGFHRSPLAYLLHGPQCGPDADPYTAVPNLLRKATDDELAALLEARAHPSWSITQLDGRRVPALPASTRADPETLRARAPRSAIDTLYRTTSFTGITAGHGATDLTGGRDVDQSTRGLDGRPAGGSDPVRLLDFPRGAHVGNFFHEVLEHAPFDATSAQLVAPVQAGLRRHGLDAPGRSELAVAALTDVLTCPLDEHGTRLADVPAADRLAELGFMLPVASALTDTDGATVALDRTALRRAFAADPTGLPGDYLDRLAQLQFVPVRGFLRGFIDLVMRVQGRWMVLDYKTNDLGSTRQDYAPARLDEAMAHEHYILQAHLYTVALVRHLRLRQPNFDYDEHFGGIRYLFLRGMHPDSGSTYGVYAHRPPKARIEALSALLGGGDA